MTDLSVPVLTYHANNITGNRYEDNDHTALAADLLAIHQAGYTIIPLLWVAEWLQGLRDLTSLSTDKLIAISCDDGISLDYADGEFLDQGQQRSFYNQLNDFVAAVGEQQQPHAHLTCFVIASAKARKAIEQHSLQGQPLMTDDWWQEAAKANRISLENHSWDHRHPAIYEPREATFKTINHFTLAEQQVGFAKQQIERITGQPSRLFCYPFGQHNEFLVAQYFPAHAARHDIIGAFSCEPERVTLESNPWCIPRYVCGLHWQTANDFKDLILRTA
jgi:hypothetical protein